MSEEKEIDCSYTREVVCPHCGYEFSNSYELGMDGDGDEAEIDCEDCGKQFVAVMDLTVKYSSHKIEPIRVKEGEE